MMRTASGLLVATLLTTSVISGTFAKYTTSDSAGDSARVAKWGVTVTATGNLFGTDYAANNATANQNSITATSNNVSTVRGDSRDNIVAPGTKNDEGFTIAIKGTPEVAYDITTSNNNTDAKEIFLAQGNYGVMVKAEGLNAKTDITQYYIKETSDDSKATYKKAEGNWADNTEYFELIDQATVNDGGYYPLTWSISNTGNATSIDSINRLVGSDGIAVKMLEGIKNGTHEANSKADASYTLTWEWKYEEQNDAADTILGDLQAGDDLKGTVVKKNGSGETYTSDLIKDTDYCLDVAFGMQVTVSQVN